MGVLGELAGEIAHKAAVLVVGSEIADIVKPIVEETVNWVEDNI